MEYYFYRYYKLPNREFVQLNEEANLQRDRLSVITLNFVWKSIGAE